MQRYKPTDIQRSYYTSLQTCKGTSLQIYKGHITQAYRGTSLQIYKGHITQAYRGTSLQIYKGHITQVYRHAKVILGHITQAYRHIRSSHVVLLHLQTGRGHSTTHSVPILCGLDAKDVYTCTFKSMERKNFKVSPSPPHPLLVRCPLPPTPPTCKVSPSPPDPLIVRCPLPLPLGHKSSSVHVSCHNNHPIGPAL